MNNKVFLKSILELPITLSDQQQEQLSIYADELLAYNSHTNVTAIKTIDEIYLKHFFDSLLITKYFDFNNIDSLLDIGTGAGFPGMVLKIVFPHLHVTLLDSNHKKTDFLISLQKKLALSDVTIINSRAEDFIKNKRDSYDTVIARAVAALPILSELCLPFVRVGGTFIALKSSYEEELEKSKPAIQILKGKIDRQEETTLPIENSRRAFIFITKQSPTPVKYPRPYAQILKKPLKKDLK